MFLVVMSWIDLQGLLQVGGLGGRNRSRSRSGGRTDSKISSRSRSRTMRSRRNTTVIRIRSGPRCGARTK